MDTYTYPTRAQLADERARVDRDLTDLIKLAKLHAIITAALHEAGEVEDLQHPEARWSIDDLLIILYEQRGEIEAEWRRVGGQP